MGRRAPRRRRPPAARRGAGRAGRLVRRPPAARIVAGLHRPLRRPVRRAAGTTGDAARPGRARGARTAGDARARAPGADGDPGAALTSGPLTTRRNRVTTAHVPKWWVRHAFARRLR